MGSLGTRVVGLAVAAACLFAVAPAANAATFSNTTPINTPGNDSSDPADVYPSPIFISGHTGSITNVRVSLLGFGQNSPNETDALLVGPGGQQAMLMSDACEGGTPDGSNFTFEDAAAVPLSEAGACMSGTFKPSNYVEEAVEAMPPPIAAGPYPFVLSVFNGTDPNGTWGLYVANDNDDPAEITGGWRLELDGVTAPISTVLPAAIGPSPVTAPESGFGGPCQKKKAKKRKKRGGKGKIATAAKKKKKKKKKPCKKKRKKKKRKK